MSKVLHVCLCGPFSDGFSYQDNVLTKYHKKLGHQVFLITSCLSWSHSGEIIKVPKANYLNEDGVNVIRLENLKNGKFN